MKCGIINGVGGLSAKSVSDILVVMRSVIKYGENEYGYRNPMRNISVPRQEKRFEEVFDRVERNKLHFYLQSNATKAMSEFFSQCIPGFASENYVL